MKQKPTKRSEQQWRDLFEAQARSGLSQAQFVSANASTGYPSAGRMIKNYF